MALPWQLDKEPFVHERLKLGGNSIRLITLYPNRDEYSFLTLDLTQYATHRQPEYVALSYMWGPEDEKYPVVMNGKSFEIRRNLHDCLVQLRKHAHEPLTLWIDALCIDQNNISERNHVVQLMDQIYERASQVFVWLGTGDESTDRAMDFLHQVAAGVENESHPHDVFLDRYMLPATHYIDWIAVVRLFKRDYWTRLWIIQETILAPQLELFCGDRRILWKHVQFVVLLAEQTFHHYNQRRAGKSDLLRAINDTIAVRMFMTRCDSQDLKGRRDRYPSLQTLLENFKDARCFEARDEIFGLLSISGDFYDKRIDYIDYSLRDSQVFIRFLKHYLKHENDLTQDETLYNVRRLSDALRLDVWKILQRRGKIFDTQASYLDITTDDEECKLTIPCTTLLRFDGISVEKCNSSIRAGLLADTLGIDQSSTQSPEKYPSGASRIFCLDSNAISKLRRLAHYKGNQIWNAFPDSTDDKNTASKSSYKPPSSSVRCFTTAQTSSTNDHSRRPFLGIACAAARPGDLLVNFHESKLAFIARQQSSENSIYDIVGTALPNKRSSTRAKLRSSLRGLWNRTEEKDENDSDDSSSSDEAQQRRPTIPVLEENEIQARFNPLMLLLLVNQPNWRKDHNGKANRPKHVSRSPSFYTAIQPQGEDDPVLKSFGTRKYVGNAHFDRAVNQLRDRLAVEVEAVREKKGWD